MKKATTLMVGRYRIKAVPNKTGGIICLLLTLRIVPRIHYYMKQKVKANNRVIRNDNL